MIVDTSFVLDVIDDIEAAVAKGEGLEAESIPSMTVLELSDDYRSRPDTTSYRRQTNTRALALRSCPSPS